MTLTEQAPITKTQELRTLCARATSLLMALALLAFLAGLSVAPSPAVDLFWQMRTGEMITLQHAVPHYDTYSWTRFGHPWIVHEWGMCVLLWSAYRAHGFPGVWFLQLGLLALTFMSLYLLLLRETGGSPLLSFCLGLWAAKIASPLISPRPHLFTWLFLTLLTGLVLTVRRDATKLKRLWLLVPMCAVWANLHGGVIVGVGIIALFGLCDLIESRLGRPDAPSQLKNAKHELLVAACCALALSLNPYGWRIYDIFRMTVANKTMPGFVTEWSALDFHSLLGYTFEALLGLMILGLALSKERKHLAEYVIVIALAHASVTASRNVPIFALIGLLVTARHIQSALALSLTTKLSSTPLSACGEGLGAGGMTQPSLFGANPPIAVAALVAAAVLLQSVGSVAEQLRRTAGGGSVLTRIARSSFALDDFPAGACGFLRAERFPTEMRLYNAYNLGGYILWTVPEYPVSISTQTDVFFGSVLDDYARLEAEPYGWRKILGYYHPDFVLTSTSEAQSRLFASDPNWQLCYADRADLDNTRSIDALIFVRCDRRFADLIARCRRDCPALRMHPELLLKPL